MGVSPGHCNIFFLLSVRSKQKQKRKICLLSMYSSRNSPAVMGGLLDIIGTVEGCVFVERWMQGLLEGKGRDERMNEKKAGRLCVCVCVCGWVWVGGVWFVCVES
jgi:hypothetical protein